MAYIFADVLRALHLSAFFSAPDMTSLDRLKANLKFTLSAREGRDTTTHLLPGPDWEQNSALGIFSWTGPTEPVCCTPRPFFFIKIVIVGGMTTVNGSGLRKPPDVSGTACCDKSADKSAAAYKTL